VDFVNDDHLTHNVFSPVDRLDMGQVKGPDRDSHRFRKLGVVDLYCNIHEQMRGALIVVPNHAHAVTGAGGAFRFTDLSPGERTVSAWLPDGETVHGKVNVEAGREAVVTLQLPEPAPAFSEAPLRRHVGYVPEGPAATRCPNPANEAPVGPGVPVAFAAPPPDAGSNPEAEAAYLLAVQVTSGHLDPIQSRVVRLRTAAELLEKAAAAKRLGNRSLASVFYITANQMVGNDALEDVARIFEEGAPPRIDTPLKPFPLDAPKPPIQVGHSEADAPPTPERSSVHGVVLLDGKKPDARVVVTMEPVGGGAKRPAPQHRVVEQRGRQFIPQLVVVPTGSTLSFPNLDPIFHNVFSRSEAKPFDLGLYGAGLSREMTFDKPGVIRLGCNIHADMSAYVVVVSEPHYSVLQDGQFRFASLKPGRYTLRVWSERTLQPQIEERTLEPGPNTVNVSLVGNAPHDNTDKYGTPR
jgi:plastocyanin